MGAEALSTFTHSCLQGKKGARVSGEQKPFLKAPTGFPSVSWGCLTQCQSQSLEKRTQFIVSSSSAHQNHQEGLLTQALLGPIPRVSHLVGLGQGLRVCSSSKTCWSWGHTLKSIDLNYSAIISQAQGSAPEVPRSPKSEKSRGSVSKKERGSACRVVAPSLIFGVIDGYQTLRLSRPPEVVVVAPSLLPTLFFCSSSSSSL